MELQAIPEPVPRVVFDAVIFVQAFLSSTGPAYAALLACAEGEANLFACKAILEEVHAVSQRPFLRKRFPDNWNERIEGVLHLFEDAATEVENPPTVFRLPRDTKDEPYLNLAIAVNARYLVSRDKDLLALMTDESPGATEFRRLYPNLKVTDPASFLRALAG